MCELRIPGARGEELVVDPKRTQSAVQGIEIVIRQVVKIKKIKRKKNAFVDLGGLSRT